MSELPDCLYCRKDQRLRDSTIEICPLSVSTLFLSREQTHRGRCIVTYRDHVNELFELTDEELVLFMKDVVHVARAVKQATGANKINYGIYSDKLPHLHMHLVPKYEGGVNWGSTFEMMPANRVFRTDAECAEIIAAIRKAL